MKKNILKTLLSLGLIIPAVSMAGVFPSSITCAQNNKTFTCTNLPAGWHVVTSLSYAKPTPVKVPFIGATATAARSNGVSMHLPPNTRGMYGNDNADISIKPANDIYYADADFIYDNVNGWLRNGLPL